MLLNDVEIKKRGLVQAATDEHYRDTGYDLTVGMIVDTAGNRHSDSFMIEASGIAEIISAETIALPPDVTGFVHVKTSVVERGLLPLNIGLIDPGWNGKISATMLNFGDGRGRLVQRGKPFLRVVFVSHKAGTQKKPDPVADDKYISDKIKKVTENFGATFLGWDRFKKVLHEQTIEELKKSEQRVLPTRIAIFGILLVIVQLAAAYAIAADPFNWSSRLSGYVSKKDAEKSALAVEGALTEQRKLIGVLRQEISALTGEVKLRSNASKAVGQ